MKLSHNEEPADLCSPGVPADQYKSTKELIQELDNLRTRIHRQQTRELQEALALDGRGSGYFECVSLYTHGIWLDCDCERRRGSYQEISLLFKLSDDVFGLISPFDVNITLRYIINRSEDTYHETSVSVRSQDGKEMKFDIEGIQWFATFHKDDGISDEDTVENLLAEIKKKFESLSPQAPALESEFYFKVAEKCVRVLMRNMGKIGFSY